MENLTKKRLLVNCVILSFFSLMFFLFSGCNSAQKNQTENENLKKQTKQYMDVSALVEAGQVEDAISHIENSLSSGPDNIPLLEQLFEIYYNNNMFENAIDTANRITSLAKENTILSEYYIRKAELYRGLKNNVKALNEINRAKKINPQDKRINSILYEIYSEMGLIELANEAKSKSE
ncbi:MAG: hypothetical protein WC002_02570 [Candidatus Muiribacteriota bacterium]|jgi:predicted Zn-dependent protease